MCVRRVAEHSEAGRLVGRVLSYTAPFHRNFLITYGVIVAVGIGLESIVSAGT
jgi:hypothetical protein